MIAARGRDEDDGLDRQVPVRRVDRRSDQRRLAREPRACRLEAHDREEEEKAVVLDELGHVRTRLRKIAPCESGFRGSSIRASAEWHLSLMRLHALRKVVSTSSSSRAPASRRPSPTMRTPRPEPSSLPPSGTPTPSSRCVSRRVDEVGRLREGQVLIGFLEPLTDPARHRTARRARRARVRDGVDPPHHARAADGRALVAGDCLRLQGGADRRGAAAAFLPDADDGSGNCRTGEGARARRRRRRLAGDRDCTPPRRRRLGLRRAAGREGTGREPRRDLPRPRDHGRGDRRRLRARVDRGGAGAPAGRAGGADPGLRRRDHDGV